MDAAPAVVGAGALVLFVLLHVTVHTPGANRAHPTREVAARFDAALPPGAEVAYVDLKFSTALMFYLQHRPLELLRIRAITDLAPHPQRYALILHEQLMWLIRKECSPPPPLGEESVFGGGYVLFDLNGVGSRAPGHGGFEPRRGGRGAGAEDAASREVQPSAPLFLNSSISRAV